MRLILRELPAAGRALTALLGAALACTAAASALSIVQMGRLVGAVADPGRASPAPVVAVLAVLLVVSTAAAEVRGLAVNALVRRLEAGFQRRLMAAAMAPTGVAHLEDGGVRDDIRTAQGSGVGQYPPGVALLGMVELAAMWLNVLAGAVLLAWSFHPAVAVLVAASTALSRHLVAGWYLDTVDRRDDHAHTLRRADYHRDLALDPRHAKELRLFGLFEWTRRRFATLASEAEAAAWRTLYGRRRKASLSLLPSMLGQAVALVAIGVASARHGIGVETVAVAIGATFQASSYSVGGADLLRRQGAQALRALLRVEAATRTKAHAGADAGTPAAVSASGDIRVEHVGFRYPGMDRPVFDGLDLVIPAGMSTGVVGANGIGKTTLAKLLMRLYEVDSGVISIGGVDVRDLDAAAWQTRFAAVFQDFTRYEMPVVDNVLLADGGGADARERRAAAAARAGAAAMIASLPRGWETILGAGLDDGCDLSGGQWQRIALARMVVALVRGAGIIVLDEPAAQLDVRAEADFIEQFYELARGHTTVVISHRLSTVRLADRICVLGPEGRVIEEGTHDSLLRRGGEYARLHELQAVRFADEVARA